MKKRIQTTSGSDLSELYKRNIELDGTYDYVEHEPKSGEFIIPGDLVDWISQGSEYTLYVPAYNLVATHLNNWDFEKMSYIAKLIERSYQGGPRPQLEMPWGHVGVITPSDVAYTQYLAREYRLEYDTTLSEPWTSGDEIVDLALAASDNKELFDELANDETEVTTEEIDEKIEELSEGNVVPADDLETKLDQISKLAEELELGDIGEIEFTLRDGNHRAFGALVAGESGVIVSASNRTDIETWPLLQQAIQPYLIDTKQYWKAKGKK